MITIALYLIAALALACLVFGIRRRQPLAIVASFFVLATPFLASFWLISGLNGDRLESGLWLAGSALSAVLAGVLVLAARRRSKLTR